MLFQKRL